MEQFNEDYRAACARQGSAEEECHFKLFSMLKPSLQQDGNQWCVLYGENLQVGIAGFGDSPQLAILDWNKEWYKSIES